MNKQEKITDLASYKFPQLIIIQFSYSINLEISPGLNE